MLGFEVSQSMSRVLRLARLIIGHFRNESFQAIICIGTENTEQIGGNTPKTQENTR